MSLSSTKHIRFRRLALVIGAFLAVGLPPAALADTWRWYYKPNYGVDVEPQPLALYSLPDTLASYVLECNWRESTLDLLAFEGDQYQGERRLEIRVGGTRFVGTERLDPPDALLTSRVSIPLGHDIIALLGQGPKLIKIAGIGWPRSLPGSPVVEQVVRECRALARTSG